MLQHGRSHEEEGMGLCNFSKNIGSLYVVSPNASFFERTVIAQKGFPDNPTVKIVLWNHVEFLTDSYDVGFCSILAAVLELL